MSNKEKCVVWGCGKFLREHLSEITNKYEIIAFLDNNSILWNTELFGKRVYSPWDIPQFSGFKIVLTMNSLHAIDSVKKEINQIVIKTGGNMIIDTSFVEKKERMDIKTLLEQQHDNFYGISLYGTFLYAIVLKLLAVENYYGMNEYGFELHRKYVGVTQPAIMYEREMNFISLIKSFETNGYSTKYPITVNSNYTIIDGTHRFACCLYNKLEEIEIRMLNTVFEERKNQIWFMNKSAFSQKEMKLIENRYYMLMKEYKLME